MITSIENRRTIRKYKEKDVSEVLLNELLTNAARAATMGNIQLYSVVVTREKEIKKEEGGSEKLGAVVSASLYKIIAEGDTATPHS